MRPDARLTLHGLAPPPVAVLGEEARILLRGARLWVMLARHRRNPRPALEPLLGSATPAFCLLMDGLVTAWPDAFTTFPPCATALSPDEHCLLRLVSLAGDDARWEAHALLEDLLGAAERERLWAAARRAVAQGLC